MKYGSPAAVAAILCAAVAGSPAPAGIVINGTRVVYPGNARDQLVQISNVGKGVELVQVWIDAGDEKSTPENAKAPFIVSPPMFRLDPGKGQGVRLAYTKEPLPTDKESLFWLNALEIPARPADSADKNFLQFSFRTRIKLFFRPPGLPGDALSAPTKVTWKLVDDGARGLVLQARNPTPYYVNFADITLAVGGKDAKGNDRVIAQRDNAHGGYIAPGGTGDFPLAAVPAELRGQLGQAVAAVISINDFGGRENLRANLIP